MGAPRTPAVIGVSLKMYLGHAATLEWCAAVAGLARAHPAVTGGQAELVVLPSYLAVPEAGRILRGVAAVGAQDLAVEDAGAFTGEVSGGQIRELGGAFVEVGHAERRRLFGETDAIVAEKTRAALRAGLTPLLCIGERDEQDPDSAAEISLRQLRASLTGAEGGSVIVAYEPVWAIGAAEPAGEEHVRVVAGALRAALEADPLRTGSAVIYGGAAGPGVMTALGDAVDGVFLGRFAHDPDALVQVLDEATRVAEGRAA